MAFILRLTSRAAWPGTAPDDDQRARAARTFERRDVDTDGLSVFEVHDDHERELVVAAIACAREDDGPVDFLEIPRDRIEAYGPITSTPGDLPVPAANALHRSLDWDAETLRRLANDLSEARAAAKRVAPKDVRTAVARVDPGDVTGADAVAFVLRVREKMGRS